MNSIQSYLFYSNEIIHKPKYKLEKDFTYNNLFDVNIKVKDLIKVI